MLAVFTVSNLLDAGTDSLRAAITAANNNGQPDTIDFSVTGTIPINSQLPTITEDLTINGGNQITIDASGGSGYRIFNIDDGNFVPDLAVTLSGLTLTGGDVTGNGGAIYSRENLTLTQSTISGNAASDRGGGIYNYGNLTVRDSTLNGNSATNYGGAIANSNYGATGTITNSTLSGNTANFGGALFHGGFYLFEVQHSTITGNTGGSSGGGIYNTGDLTLSHTIVAGNNSPVSIGIDIANVSTLTVDGYNLFGDSSRTTTASVGFITLGATDITTTSDGTLPTALDDILDTTLANNGGPTETHALVLLSPAIDAGLPGIALPPLFDQRGTPFDRIVDVLGGGDVIDIGAYEEQQPLPASLVVSTITDEFDEVFGPNELSLREAIFLGNAGIPGLDVITFDPIVFATAKTILLESRLPTIVTDLTITGPGETLLTIDAGDGTDNQPGTADGYRLFIIDDNDSGNVIEVEISGLTLTGGDVPVSDLAGRSGAIHNLENLTVTSSTLSGNSAILGGGIANYGMVTITNGTLSGNMADYGGGIFNNGLGTATVISSTISGNMVNGSGGGILLADGTLTVISSTISGNSAFFDRGGGIFYTLGSLHVTSSTITGNTAGTGAGGIDGSSDGVFTLNNSIVSGNYFGLSVPSNLGKPATGDFNLLGAGNDTSGTNNVVSDNPLLGPLADNGGPTQTHALLPGSPALDAGSSSEATDQRGLGRPVDLPSIANGTGNASDIGAYEAQSAPSADFVDDDLITGLDFLAWQRGAGTTSGATRADGNSDDDGDVDGSDLAAWEITYGQVETTPLAAASSEQTATSSVASASAARSEALIDAAIALHLASEPTEVDETLLFEPLQVEELRSDFAFARRDGASADDTLIESTVAAKEVEMNADEPAWLADELLERVFG